VFYLSPSCAVWMPQAMSIRGNSTLGEIGYELCISMPEFLSETWILDQCNRINQVAQRVLALYDAGNRGALQVYWSKQREGCLVAFRTRNADILKLVTVALNEHGYPIEDIRSETIQANR